MTRPELEKLSYTELSELASYCLLGLAQEYYGDPPDKGPGWSDIVMYEWKRRYARIRMKIIIWSCLSIAAIWSIAMLIIFWMMKS